jgi:F-type H+-transporting ATPase subunit delta
MPSSSAKQLINAIIERDAELSGALGKDLSVIDEAIESEERLEAFLRNPAVKIEEKKRALEAAFPQVSPQARNTVLAFVRRGLFEDLPEAIDLVAEAELDRQGRVLVLVRSAVPLEESQRLRLKTAIHNMYGKEPVLDEEINADLLGGIRVKIKDLVYDGTLSGRLRKLSNKIKNLR